LKSKGYSFRDIAQTLNRSVSTIHDEFERNKVNEKYDPKKAHHKAYVKRKYSKYQGMKIVEDKDLRKFVETNLYQEQSPTNIAGRIKKHEKRLSPVSKDSIYRYIKSAYGRNIESFRAKRKNRRRKRRGSTKKLQDRKFIDKRPKHINKRRRIGDTEADFLVSGKTGKGVILNVTDRKSRAPFLEQIKTPTLDNVTKSFLKIKKRFPELKTITTDNDLLMQHHKKLEKILQVKIYFCHPYSSWEKGTVENINSHIRKDIPKGSDISKYSKKFLAAIETKLQRKFMECLNHLTPLEVIQNHRKQKQHRNAGKISKTKCSD